MLTLILVCQSVFGISNLISVWKRDEPPKGIFASIRPPPSVPWASFSCSHRLYMKKSVHDAGLGKREWERERVMSILGFERGHGVTRPALALALVPYFLGHSGESSFLTDYYFFFIGTTTVNPFFFHFGLAPLSVPVRWALDQVSLLSCHCPIPPLPSSFSSPPFLSFHARSKVNLLTFLRPSRIFLIPSKTTASLIQRAFLFFSLSIPS